MCDCGKCEYNLVSAHETERETIRVHDFLFGLDDIHNSVCSQICAQITSENRAKQNYARKFENRISIGFKFCCSCPGTAQHD